MNRLLTMPDSTVVDLWTETESIRPDNLIFMGHRGSHSHGTFIPSSNPNSIDDIDLMGVFIGPLEHHFGFGRKGTIEHKPNSENGDPWDLVFYEFKKFVSLLVKNNPNVLSMLWLDDDSVVYENEIWQKLVKMRGLFATKLAHTTFTGYAFSQLKKMTALDQEAQRKITWWENRLTEELGLVFDNGKPKLPPGASPALIEEVRQYNALVSKYFNGYMGHKRKSLVLKYGYDTKNAAHLIRLMRMCVEFLKTGVMVVKRPDAQTIKDIKQGKWPLADVKHESDALFLQADEALAKSQLPDRPDEKVIETMLVSVLKDYYVEQKKQGTPAYH